MQYLPLLDEHNYFMTFRYEDTDVPVSFGYVLNVKGLFGIVVANAGDNENFAQESVRFPTYLMGGSERDALVHYVAGRKFACYVPVNPTEQEAREYSERFR